ncbi:MAG: ECF transporter S component [Candidatus Hodarchaeota archaeon]
MVIRVALIAVFAALAIAGNYALSGIPNVELSSIMVFLSGFLFGPLIGAFAGGIAMIIYQLWNPWGAFIPTIGLVVIGCTSFIGIVGGIVGKGLRRLNYADSRWLLLPALFGILLTSFYDLATNFAYSLSFHIPFMIAFFTGLPFMILHILSNAVLFALLTQPITRATYQLQQSQFRLHEDVIETNK